MGIPVKSIDPLELKLVAQARQGDREAFGGLVELFQKRLMRFCVVMVGTAAEAEEICQETFVRAFQEIKNLSDDSQFLNWLFRISKNYFLDQKKSAFERLRESSAKDFSELVSDAADLRSLIAIREALSQFETKDRLLLVLIDLEGHSYAEAGEIVGISEDAVRTRLFRLRKAFIEKFKAS